MVDWSLYLQIDHVEACQSVSLIKDQDLKEIQSVLGELQAILLLEIQRRATASSASEDRVLEVP
jgi:hypothetical protein